VFDISILWQKKLGREFVICKDFVPYVFHHTDLTNHSAGVDLFTLQTIARHSSIATAQRFFRAQADVVARGFKKLA
jgi:hypothetical protein